MFGSLTIKCLYLHRQNSIAAKMWVPLVPYFYAKRTTNKKYRLRRVRQRTTPAKVFSDRDLDSP